MNNQNDPSAPPSHDPQGAAGRSSPSPGSVLPCPFCGSSAYWPVASDDMKMFWLECTVCHATGPRQPFGIDLATFYWNRRKHFHASAAGDDLAGYLEATATTAAKVVFKSPAGSTSPNEKVSDGCRPRAHDDTKNL